LRFSKGAASLPIVRQLKRQTELNSAIAIPNKVATAIDSGKAALETTAALALLTPGAFEIISLLETS
jgi:hypothetical protein